MRSLYLTIVTVIFSRVKILYFRAKVHLVFHWSPRYADFNTILILKHAKFLKCIQQLAANYIEFLFLSHARVTHVNRARDRGHFSFRSWQKYRIAASLTSNLDKLKFNKYRIKLLPTLVSVLFVVSKDNFLLFLFNCFKYLTGNRLL